MTGREYLRRAFEIDRRLQARYRRLSVLESRASGSYYREESEVCHQTYVRSRMEEYSIKVVELQELISDDEKLLSDVRGEIKSVIRAVGNELYISVLDMRYLQYLSWDEICAQTGYSKSYIFKLHGCALEYVVIPKDKETE